jgi:hypothetical protein
MGVSSSKGKDSTFEVVASPPSSNHIISILYYLY